MNVEFEDPSHPGTWTKKAIYDLSERGISFIVLDREKVWFKVEQPLNKVTFMVGSKKFQFQGIIRNVVKLPKSSKRPGYKVGVEFINMTPEDIASITNLLGVEAQRIQRMARH